MKLGEAFTALLTTAEKRRNRFVDPSEFELHSVARPAASTAKPKGKSSESQTAPPDPR